MILSHIYLLIGCAYPILMETKSNNNAQDYILSISGCLIIGIGDSFAAIIGTKYGKYKILKNGEKSYEGLLACFFSMFILTLILIFMLNLYIEDYFFFIKVINY